MYYYYVLDVREIVRKGIIVDIGERFFILYTVGSNDYLLTLVGIIR